MTLGKGEKPRRSPDVVLIVGRGWELVGERRERNKRRRVRMGDFATVNMTGFKECAIEKSAPERRTYGVTK